jgi:hypothetical protein
MVLFSNKALESAKAILDISDDAMSNVPTV